MVQEEIAQKAEPPKPRPPKRCKCGHTRDHYMVSAAGEYTFSGYLRLFFGISARPLKVKYHCRRCDTVFDSTTDPAILDKHY